MRVVHARMTFFVITILFAYNGSFWSYLSLGIMLDRFVLKNNADCTGQCLKRSSGARVMTFLLKLHLFVVFEPREYARKIDLKSAADCTSQCLKRSSGARVMTFLCPTNNSYAPR